MQVRDPMTQRRAERKRGGGMRTRGELYGRKRHVISEGDARMGPEA
jgi:hypothetical protein